MYEGHVTFRTEQEATRLLEQKEYQFAPGFSLSPTNKPFYQVKRITEYPSRVFTGFHPSSKAEDLCHQIMTFPCVLPRKKYNQRI
ncbi:hypothetical protein DSO57_1020141 [Entomophthora muscae]|nr:hypothetical protein DSO57_1020141 [Entomophthora muscae]